jgi:hypothetical protein
MFSDSVRQDGDRRMVTPAADRASPWGVPVDASGFGLPPAELSCCTTMDIGIKM